MSRRWCAATLVVLSIAGCDFPRDAGGTLARIRSEGVLRAGYTERPPWVLLENGKLAGIEPRLIEAFASSQGARVEWVSGSESSLVEALHAGQIAILVGGFLSDTRWTSRAALSRSYAAAELLVADFGASLDQIGSHLAGAVIAYRPGRPDFAALIADRGAKAQASEDWRARVSVAYDFELTRGARRGASLRNEKHVMLATQGESGFLFELDRFLARSGKLSPANGS